MEPEEVEELVDCWDCGATVSPSEDVVFQFGDRAVLCLECAIKRGGEYEAEGDRWARLPHLDDMPNERRNPLPG
jgi:hypothetical protein